MGRRFFTWWIVLVPVIVVGLAAPLQGQGDPPIAPGDALAITVLGEQTLTGKYTVGSEGTFEFPLIGRVLAVRFDFDVVGMISKDERRLSPFIVCGIIGNTVTRVSELVIKIVEMGDVFLREE